MSPALAQEIVPALPDAGVERGIEPSIIVGVPSTQRSLFDELQSIDMTSTAIPHPPQQLQLLHGATGLSGLVASGAAAQAQADKHAQPPGLIALAAAAGTDGSVATASIFSKALSHTQPQDGSLSTPSVERVVKRVYERHRPR